MGNGCRKPGKQFAINLEIIKVLQYYKSILPFTRTLRNYSINVFQNLIIVFDRKDIVLQVG